MSITGIDGKSVWESEVRLNPPQPLPVRKLTPSESRRLRFWMFAHDKLEAAWHWVYSHKIAPAEVRTGERT